MQPEQISEIINLLSASGSQAVQHYAIWFIASAIGWILFGLSFWVAAYYAFKSRQKIQQEFEHDTQLAGYIFAVIFAFLGGLFVVCNVPDLFSPTGIAIHQLIQDMR